MKSPHSEKLEKKATKRLAQFEIHSLMKEKRSEDMATLEEVFDRPTLMIVYKLLNTESLRAIHGAVRSGKESRLYWGKDAKGRDVAVKIYLTTSAEFKRGRLAYIEGDPRFGRVKRDTRSLVYLWAKKEFTNLAQAAAARVRVPRPILVEGNVLLMEFLGREGKPAPLLREYVPSGPLEVYKSLLRSLKFLYRKAELVHGDLSEYNIMIWKDEPVIFDMSQSVSVEHPMAEMMLKRDIENLNGYFGRISVKVRDPGEVLAWVTENGIQS